MALFEIDGEQFQQLTNSISQLSDNIGKWQGEQTAVIRAGLTALVAAITGADVQEVQQRINEFTQRLNASSDRVENAIKQHSEEGEK